MAVLQSTTRATLRQAVGRSLKMRKSEATSGGTTTTLISSLLPGGDDEHNGHWIVLHDGNNSGHIARVTDYVASTNTLTFTPAATTATADGDTFELWKPEFDPADANDFINDAIRDITGLFFDPVEDASLHADGRQARFDIPTGIEEIHRVEYRSSMRSKSVHQCSQAWDEKEDADFTVSVDTEDYKRKSSVKIVVAGTAAAGDSISDAINSLDLSGYTHIEFWAKCTVAVTAGELELHLDDTASIASPLETLAFPALTADTWTRCRIALANPELDTAIISVGLEYTTDIGACTIWLDDIVAVDEGSEVWSPLAPHLWGIDPEARVLVLKLSGRLAAGYARLKLVGGDKPALLTTDAGTTEVPPEFIVNWVTAHMLLAEGGGAATDPDSNHQRSVGWLALAQQARNGIHLPMGSRMVS